MDGSLMDGGWFIAYAILVSRPGNTFTKSSEFLEDRIGRGDPPKRSGFRIVLLDKRFNVVNQVLHTPKRPAADDPLGDEVKPNLHLIQPRGVGGRVVHMIARARRQPRSHLGVLVRGVVVHNEVEC